MAINNGLAKIQNGNFKIIHTIDLDKYEEFIDQANATLLSTNIKSHILFPLLQFELTQIKDILTYIKPKRNKRSLNFIGSAWKWLAGSPDHDDLVLIENKANNLIENNENQIVINELYNKRINNITIVTNKILKEIRENKYLDNELLVTLKYKIKIIKEELVNIKYAIHWAKEQILNSIILSTEEIDIAIKALNKEKFPFNTVEEALEFSNVKIFTNNSILIYVVNIPLTDLNLCEKLSLKPIKRNNKVIKLPNENDCKILICENRFYSIKKPCKTLNKLSVCNSENVIEIKNSDCIPNLLRSLNSSCSVTNAQHIPSIEIIEEGIIFLNQFEDTITVNGVERPLSGSFLVKFHNATIGIKDQTYRSEEISSVRVLPAIIQPQPYEKEINEVLSLEMMRELHIKNREHIEKLEVNHLIHQSISYGTVMIIIGIIGLMFFMRREKTKVTIKHEETHREVPSEVSIAPTTFKPMVIPTLSQLRSPSIPKIYDAPYF